jgi:hypothetical protein
LIIFFHFFWKSYMAVLFFIPFIHFLIIYLHLYISKFHM